MLRPTKGNHTIVKNESVERKKIAPSVEFEKITFVWLTHHLPIRYWVGIIAAAIALVGIGIKLGQIDWVKKLFGY